MYTGQTELLTNSYRKTTGQEPVLDQIRRRKWNWLGHTLKEMMTASPNRRYSGHLAPQGDRGSGRRKSTLKKRSGERNVDSSIQVQVQLEEDGGDSIRQSWMETSGLWLMLYRERQGE